LLAGERVTFRPCRQTPNKPVLLNPVVFLGVVVGLFARAFVLVMSFPLAAASVAVVALTARAAAPWSMGQYNLPRGSTAPNPDPADWSAQTALDAGSFVVELFRQETSGTLTTERVRQKVVGIVAAVAFCPCARRFSPEARALTVYLTWDWLSHRNVRLHRSAESGNVRCCAKQPFTNRSRTPATVQVTKSASRRRMTGICAFRPKTPRRFGGPRSRHPYR
jgi:hypothetical protein